MFTVWPRVKPLPERTIVSPTEYRFLSVVIVAASNAATVVATAKQMASTRQTPITQRLVWHMGLIFLVMFFRAPWGKVLALHSNVKFVLVSSKVLFFSF